MIFPTLLFIYQADIERSVFLYGEGLVNRFHEGKLSIVSDTNASIGLIHREDGVSLQVSLADTGYGEMKLQLSHGGEALVFEHCVLDHFGDGWLIAKRIADGIADGFTAYDYINGRRLDFSRTEATKLYWVGGFFFARTRRKWRVLDVSGAEICAFDIVPDGDGPLFSPDIYRFGQHVFMSSGGEAGNSYYDVFSLQQAAGQERRTLAGYIYDSAVLDGDHYLLKQDGIYRVASDDIASSNPVVHIDPSTIGGGLWLWSDGTRLYLASSAERTIRAYLPSGELSGEVRLPDDWRVAHVRRSAVEETGHNLVFLGPADSTYWGYSGVLTWAADEAFDSHIMEREKLSFESVEQQPVGELHGYSISVESDELDVLARQAAYHLARTVNRVAPGTMNRGLETNQDFNGDIDVHLITPSPLDSQSASVLYLQELFRQMTTIPQSYRAGNGKDPLALKIYWGADREGARTLIA